MGGAPWMSGSGQVKENVTRLTSGVGAHCGAMKTSIFCVIRPASTGAGDQPAKLASCFAASILPVALQALCGPAQLTRQHLDGIARVRHISDNQSAETKAAYRGAQRHGMNFVCAFRPSDAIAWSYPDLVRFKG